LRSKHRDATRDGVVPNEPRLLAIDHNPRKVKSVWLMKRMLCD